MARADLTLLGIEGHSAVGDVGEPGGDYGVEASATFDVGVFGPGTVGRKMLYVWGASALVLVIYWRAAKGY